MIVILVIAILIAMAIPTFLSVRARAQDRAAQAGVTTAVKVEAGLYTDNEVFVANPAELQAAEPSLDFRVNLPSTDPNEVSVFLPPGNADQVVILGALSNSGECFYVQRNAQGATTQATTPAVGQSCTHDPNTGTWTVGW